MRVGYTCKLDNQKKLLEDCDEVVLANIKNQTVTTFLEFIKKNIGNEIYIINHLDLGLQLIQLLPSLKYLDEHHAYLRIRDKNFQGNISDPMYQKLLLDLAHTEKKVMSNRMKLEAERAKLLGLKQAGRPKVTETKILMIREMYHNKKMTLREVAQNCDVSIGTAYKYAIQLPSR